MIPLLTTIHRCSFVSGARLSIRTTLCGKQNQSPTRGTIRSNIEVCTSSSGVRGHTPKGFYQMLRLENPPVQLGRGWA